MKLRKSYLNSGGNLNGPCPCGSQKNFRQCCARAKNPTDVFTSLVTVVWEHIQANRLQEAENLCWRLLELYPNYPDLLHFLGIIAFYQKLFEKAVSLLRKAVALAPNNAGYRSSLGNILRAMNCLEESLVQLQTGASLAPNLAPIHLNMGIVLKTLNRQEEAFHCYRRALALAPDFVEAHFNLGILLQDQKQYPEAEAAYRQGLRIKPDYAELLTNLGNLLKELKRFEESESSYRYALQAKPDYADAYSNLGTLLKELKRFDEAEAAYRQALRLKPDFADANWNLSLLYLSLGRFQEGWLLYEERYNPDRKERSTIPIQVPFPMWRGEDLMGKSLLIIPEQGFGDQIQFCRYTAELRSRGAKRITLVCKEYLESLFASLDGVDRVLVSGQTGDDSPHDYWTFYLSIPRHLGTTLANVPAQIPYLSAPADRLTRWENFLPQQGLRVGLVWRGNPTHKNDANRSLPSLTVLAPLWSVPGISFISLQKGEGEEEARKAPQGQPIVHAGSSILDFSDTAAIITHLDLVISIDSAVAHLAGALGKPCWVLLPAFGTDWRWMHHRTDSPWYPGVMRLFRQARPDDWSEVVQQIAAELVQVTQNLPGTAPSMV